MSTHHVEREIKLGAAAGFVLPSGALGRYRVTDPRHTLLESVYYDTPDYRLARSGATLRFRMPEGWTLKLPKEPVTGAGGAIVRYEVHFDGEGGTVPGEALEAIAALLRGGSVSVAARLSTRRTAENVLDSSGRRVAELVDDDVSVLPEGPEAIRFHELEVELAPDTDDAALDRLVSLMEDRGASQVDQQPKLARALQRDIPERPIVPIGETLPIAAARLISQAAAAIVCADPFIRLGIDPEYVHIARVATRRLRAMLRVTRDWFDADWSNRMVDDITWLGGALGSARDAGVLQARLEADLAEVEANDGRASKVLLDVLEREAVNRSRELLTVLRSSRYLALLDALDHVSDHLRPVDTSEEASPKAVVKSVLKLSWRRVKRHVHGLSASPTDADLHRLRIKAKRCRYAAEVGASLLHRDAVGFTEAARTLQDVLGELHDSVVALAWLRRHAARFSSGAAFVAGELAMVELRRADKCRQRWPSAWRTLAGQKRP